MRLPLLEIQHSPQDQMRYQVVLEEVIQAAQVQILTLQGLLDPQTAVLLTTDPLEQVMGQVVLPMAEVSQMGTPQEAHRAGRPTTLQTTVRRADLALVVPSALQVGVQEDLQAAVAQEDPEEGGINSPFFLQENYPKRDFASLISTT